MPKIRSLLRSSLNAPVLLWVWLGFLAAYLFLFVQPIFLSAAVMQFPQSVPFYDPIGIDLKQMLSYSASWAVARQTPYIGNNLYPPLASVLFTPLLQLSFPAAYRLITLVNLLAGALLTLALPVLLNKGQNPALLTFIFAASLFSYGFQFELERGQFNLIAMLLCLLSLWLYHAQPRFRYLAYILFSAAVQLKVFPLIFSILLIDDWRAWRSNFRRLALLICVNFELFLILGLPVFVDFIRAIKAQTVNPGIWVGNHSIRSFVTWSGGLAAERGWTWVNEYAGPLQFVLLALVGVCLGLVTLQAYRQRQPGLNAALLLACTLGAMLIPSQSHDYKLSILAAPVALFLAELPARAASAWRLWRRLTFIGLALLLSALYASTLFAFTYRPLWLGNSCPALLLMLATVTGLAAISRPGFGAPALSLE